MAAQTERVSFYQIVKSLMLIAFIIYFLGTLMFGGKKDEQKNLAHVNRVVKQLKPEAKDDPVYGNVEEKKAVAEMTTQYQDSLVRKFIRNPAIVNVCKARIEQKATFDHKWTNNGTTDVFASWQMQDATNQVVILTGDKINNGGDLGIPYECWIDLALGQVMQVTVNGI